MREDRDRRSERGAADIGRSVAIGAGIGIVFGAAFGAAGPGMVLGAALGLAGAFRPKRHEDPDS